MSGEMARTRDGEQSPTSDELEIDRLRLEVARLRSAIASVAAELEAESQEFGRIWCQARPAAYWVRSRARDLRAVLDQGAPRCPRSASWKLSPATSRPALPVNGKRNEG